MTQEDIEEVSLHFKSQIKDLVDWFTNAESFEAQVKFTSLIDEFMDATDEEFNPNAIENL